MGIFWVLLAVALADDIQDIVNKQKDLNEQLSSVTNLVHDLARLTTESNAGKLQSQLNSLKEEIGRMRGTIESLEKTSDDLGKEQQSFDLTKADFVVKTMTDLAEQIAVLDGKLSNLDDREIIDKIEKAMKGIATSDSQIRNTVFRIKEQVEYLDKVVKKDSNFFWIYVIIGLMCIAIGFSYRVISKASSKTL